MPPHPVDAATSPGEVMLERIIHRRSASALAGPGPTDAQLARILAAGASVPDHGRLRPYRFVVVRGEARARLGAALTAAAVEADADPVTIAKAGRKPLLGPVLVVIIASPQAHATVPEWEQVASATLTGYAIELAADALGVAAVWKSGHHLEGAPMRRLLELGPAERVLGWIVLGDPVARGDGAEDRRDDVERPAPRVRELRVDPLISVQELQRRLGEPDLVVCDTRWYLGDPVRGGREYLERHIPGARFVDLETDLSDHAAPGQLGRHPLPDAGRFGARAAQLGIGPDTLVVAYDDGSGVPASRLWWMLDSLGHRSVRVLDGGMRAWDAAGAPTSDLMPPPVHDAVVDPWLADVWPRTIERDALRARLGAGDVILLDVRAAERYRGEVEPVDPRPGHIPGALSAPSTASVVANGSFHASQELEARFRDLGAGEGDVVVSCGSGVTACHTALAMRIAGLPDPVLYAGSYSDWVVAGLPVVTGASAWGPPDPEPRP